MRPKALGEGELDVVHCISECLLVGLTYEEMHVLRHHDVSLDPDGKTAAHFFEAREE